MVQDELGLFCGAFEHTFAECGLAILEGAVLFLQNQSCRCSLAVSECLEICHIGCSCVLLLFFWGWNITDLP